MDLIQAKQKLLIDARTYSIEDLFNAQDNGRYGNLDVEAVLVEEGYIGPYYFEL